MVRKFYETEEAAKVLGITPEQLNEMRDRREVYAVRDGGTWKFKIEEIDRLVAERAEGILPEDSSEYDDLDDDPDSILVSDLGLTPSSAGASSTVIGKSNAPSSPASDIHIASSKSDESDLNLDLPMGSDVRLDTSDEADASPSTGLSAKFDDLDTLDLEMPSAEESGISLGSDVMLTGTQDLILPDDPVSLSDKPVTAKPPSDGGGSVLELGDEDDVLGLGSSGIDSDVTRSVSDSGISLIDPSDSGLSLERNDLQLAGSKLESLDLGGDDLITLEDEDLSEATTQLKADDDFLLTPAEEATTEESSGSQVIALDSELDFDESQATMIGGGMGVAALEEVEEEAEPAFSAMSSGDLGPSLGSLPPTTTLAPAPAVAAMTAASDPSFALWNILLLVPLLICLIFCGMMMFDLMRNMWSWNGAYPVNSSLMDMMLSWFEK